MSLVTGAQTTADIRGIREDLTDMIYQISPTKTPFLNKAGKGKATNTLHEWQVDELAAAVSTNFVSEGNIATFATPAATTRIGNQCQIAEKTAAVTGTVESVNKAGRKSEMAKQLAKRSAELKRDMEKHLLSNQAASGSDPRKAAGLIPFLKTNVSFATASGVNPVYTSLPNNARTDATAGDLRTFQESQLQTVVQECWNEGAEPTILLMGGARKTDFSTFAGNADKVFNINSAKPGAIISAADVYVSNFGTLSVVLDRFMRDRDVFVLDFEYISVPYLRAFATEDIAKVGDATRKMMNVEYTLKVGNEKSQGAIFDLTD